MRKSLHPNQQDDLGYTLLHHATLNGHREVVSVPPTLQCLYNHVQIAQVR